MKKEDVILGKTLVFTDKCSYKRDLIDFCAEQNISYAIVSNGDPWIRDYLFQAPDKLHIRNKVPELSRELLAHSYPPWQKDHSAKFPRITGSDQRNLNSIAFRNSDYLHQTNYALEGGMFFCAQNSSGEEYFIIGENIFFLEQNLRHRRGKASLSREQILNRYKKKLQTENIIIVPNLMYHIDLQMAYIGRGIFLVHSFSEMSKHFPDEYGKLFAFCNEKWAGLLEAKEVQADNVVQLLTNQGFSAKKFCGHLYNVDESPCIWGGTGLMSTFVNGIDVYAEMVRGEYEDEFSWLQRTHYFITMDSGHVSHKEYFQKLMFQLSVTPRFVTNETKDIGATLKEVSIDGGALRCQTNFIDSKGFVPQSHSQKSLLSASEGRKHFCNPFSSF